MQYLREISTQWYPMHHTLFKTAGRAFGMLVGDPYRGFLVLDMLTSALALVGVWWLLRAIVPPRIATAGAFVLGVGPNFWGYGAIAGNYTAIVLVGSLLMGIAIRGYRRPAAWHPDIAALVLAIGAGYRSDIGLFWFPTFAVILWQHRWKRSIVAAALFLAINLVWFIPMLDEAGGWHRYREATSEFGRSAGALNSYWNLGFVDGPVRYAVKLGLALAGTLGPALIFVPRGLARLRSHPEGRFLVGLLAMGILLALSTHLLIHFGVPGYCFHYLPALMVLIVLGIGRDPTFASLPRNADHPSTFDRAEVRLLGMATVLALFFWFYPATLSAPGWRGELDLALGRLTRAGIAQSPSERQEKVWPTANSQRSDGLGIH